MACTIDWSGIRLVSPNGIRHKVMNGGLTFTGDEEKFTAKLDLLIRAEDFEDFVEELFPHPVIINDTVAITGRMYLKEAPYLRVKSFSTGIIQEGLPLDPMNADPTAPDGTYGWLMPITINFETMQETDDEEPDEGNPTTFLDHSVSAGMQYLRIPPKKIDVSEKAVEEYTPGGPDVNNPGAPGDAEANKDPDIGIYKTLVTVEHSLKWKFALNPHWTNIYRRLGTVNKETLALFNNAKRETVLFTGISGQRSYRYFRRRTNITPWSLDFKFSQLLIAEGSKTYGWNHVYSPSKQKWVRPIRVNDANKSLYELSDFNLLFRSGS